MSGDGAREALENGKGAVEVDNLEAALGHFDRAISLSVDGEEVVRSEAMYQKGKALFQRQSYSECLPPLRDYLEQDRDDALGFHDEAKSYLFIAEGELGAASSTSAVELNPAHQDAGTVTNIEEGQRFDGRLSGGRLRTSGGRTYSAPEPASEDVFERDAWSRGVRRGGVVSTVQAECCGESQADQCLCCWSVAMAFLAATMWLYGIVA